MNIQLGRVTVAVKWTVHSSYCSLIMGLIVVDSSEELSEYAGLTVFLAVSKMDFPRDSLYPSPPLSDIPLFRASDS